MPITYGYQDDDGIQTVNRVLGALNQMKRLQSAEAEQENVALRGMLLRRELAGPSEQQKFQFEQQKFLEQQRHEQVKFALTTFNQLAKESSPATKSVLMEHMGRLWSSMAPGEQAAAKMIYDHSPLNPIEQKSTWWDSTMKAPQVVADPQKDPYAYGVQLFNLDDYQQQRQNFVSGTPIQRRRIVGLAEGVFAIRDEAGNVSITTSQDMQLKQIADEHNTTPGAILANNGKVYGTEREVMVGGVLSKVRNVYDALKRAPAGTEVTPTSGSIGALEKNQQDIQDFLASWAGDDATGNTQGSRIYKTVKAMREADVSTDQILRFVKNVYPEWNFKLDTGVEKRGLSRVLPWNWFSAYAEVKDGRLVAWPGVAIEAKASNGTFKVYHDARTGKIYSPSGKILSNSYDEFTNYIATRTMEQIQKEAQGK